MTYLMTSLYNDSDTMWSNKLVSSNNQYNDILVKKTNYREMEKLPLKSLASHLEFF